MSDPTGWLAAKPNAPLSTAAALSSIFVAPSILLLVSRPGMFRALDLGKLLLVSAGIGFPILALCAATLMAIFYGMVEWDKPLPNTMVAPLLDLAENPRLEWAGLWAGAGVAHGILYGLTAYAIFYTFDLWRTLGLVVGILVATALLTILLVMICSAVHRQNLPRRP